MSRLFTAVLAALIALAAMPAFAAEGPRSGPAATAVAEVAADSEETGEAEIVECDNADDLEVITRDGAASEIAAPSFVVGNEWEYKDFLVDLQATTTDATASIDTAMTWDFIANDYDLQVGNRRSSGISEGYQPFDPAEEFVGIVNVGHCEVVTVGARDFLASVVVDTLALDFRVSRFVDPGPAEAAAEDGAEAEEAEEAFAPAE